MNIPPHNLHRAHPREVLRGTHGMFMVKEPYEKIGDLQVSPFADFGTPIEIVELFGGREPYMQVVREIQRQLYTEG